MSISICTASVVTDVLYSVITEKAADLMLELKSEHLIQVCFFYVYFRAWGFML